MAKIATLNVLYVARTKCRESREKKIATLGLKVPRIKCREKQKRKMSRVLNVAKRKKMKNVARIKCRDTEKSTKFFLYLMS